MANDRVLAMGRYDNFFTLAKASGKFFGFAIITVADIAVLSSMRYKLD